MIYKHKEKINIGIIWANPFSKNLGVAALSYSILFLLKEIEEKSRKQFNILIVGSSIEGKREIVINNKKIIFDNTRRKRFLAFKGTLKFILFPRKSRLIDFLKFDYVFDLGEGDSYSDIYGKERFTKLNNSKKFFTFLKKKQFLLPQTIGPFSDERVKKSAFSVLKNIEQICVRDKLSYIYVKENLPNTNVQEFIDIAFALPFVNENKNNEITKIGINISGLLWGGGYTKNNQFNLKVDYEDLIKEIIEYFISLKNTEIHLVGHVFDPKRNIENDFFVNQSIKVQYPEVVLAPEFSDPIIAKSYISNLDFFIGSRMHACIAAFSSGVPVFPLAYSRKFNGLFCDTLDYKYVGDCVNETKDNIMKHLIDAFNHFYELKENIFKINNNLVQKVIQNLKLSIKAQIGEGV